MKYNVIYIKGVPHTQREGCGMGCGFSAGGCSLTIAVNEDKKRRRTSKHILEERKATEVGFRWMDDIIYATVSRRTKGARDSLRADTDTNSYGDKLKLKKLNSNTAFGQVFEVDAQEQISVKPAGKYIKDFKTKCLPVRDVNVFDGSQFTSARVRKGVVKGYVYRILDGSNIDSFKMSLEIQRLCSELLVSHVPIKDIKSSLDACSKCMLKPIHIPDDFWGRKDHEYQAWNIVYDWNSYMNSIAMRDRMR